MTEKIEKLWSKNAAEGCAAMKVLEREAPGQMRCTGIWGSSLTSWAATTHISAPAR